MIAVGYELGQFFDSVRDGKVVTPARHPKAQPAPVAAQLSSEIMTLRKAYDVYLADPSRKASPKTLLAYQTVGDVIMDLIGPETPLQAITRKACRDLMADLAALPRNARKRWPSLNARQAIVRGRQCDVPMISIANINGYLNKFCAMMNWAVREELLDKNPAVGLRFSDPVQAKDKRRPFDVAQLQKIFNAPLYRGCVDDEYGYSKVGC